LRILVLTSTFPRWRGDREPPFVYELCRRLAAGHEVLVIAPHSRGAAVHEHLADNLAVRRFRYAPLALESLAYEGGILEKLRRGRWRWMLVPLFLAAEVLAVARALRGFRPHVVHAHWIVPQGVAALLAGLLCRRAPTTLVCTSHGADLFALRGALAGRLKAWVVRRAGALTVVSAVMKTAAVQLGARPEAVHVMPMGVDARERFTPEQAAVRSTAELLFVGRLVRKKGVTHLPRILELVRRRVPQARLTIVGAGPLESELRAEARARGLEAHLAFAGAVANDELAPYYRRAAAFVAPSVVTAEGDQEGLGLVMAEALACGCPVVASDLPAIRDLIEDDVTGVLAAAGDAAHFADEIVQLLADPQRAARLARDGRMRVVERFDWQSVGWRYEALLTAVAG
jgi:glycosyltransferase involved in cell wall biosynthesis